ncbi:MAG TPA: hypothetical protein HPP94_02280 [Desulfuromonadales bacterium]|nr:hypothetical protein [Desulfuromonadales bacterium]
MNIKTLIRTLALLIVVTGTAGTAQAYEGRFLAHEDIILYGMGLKVEPARQVVPKNIATIVSSYTQVPTLPNAEIPPLAADALVKGTLRGPGLETPLELTARANTPFNIPPLTVPGIYSLDNIRLESGGEVLLRGTPESVTIEIIEKLLVSQITARPLTAQEIKDKGIVFDKTNFQAYNFTAAFAIGSGDPVKINMPVILPNLAGATDVNVSEAGIGSTIPEPQLKDVRTIIPDSLKLAQTKVPNLSVKSFSLKALDYKGNSFDVPPIPGVIVIPGDIGFLNQYFSVMLMVGNVAPEYSNLVVKDITATILLPAGNDKVVGTSDDPLAMANTTKGPSPKLQAVVQPGPDGKLGTADDIVSLAPGESGNAEFLVEGRREGSHTIEMEITGTLVGLPIGPVTVRGRAMGTVLVRNPNFTLTFTHPDVVNAGEAYTLDVTVTNTSQSPANFVSVNLHQQQISGADLIGEGSKQIETIPPGDSATVSFDLRSKVSGTIFAATLDADDHVSGRFQLKTSVGELGIPLSPDSLVLPKEAGSLPKSLRDAAIGVLGKAYAVATAPDAALPKDIQRFGKKIVWDRGIEVAQAGFRYTLHEPLPDSAEQLLLDFMGSNYTRLAETNPLPADRANAESDYNGFDDLRRRSVRGDVLADAVANLLKPDLTAKGGADFQRDLASKIAYRPEHISVMLDSGSAPLPVTLTLIDSTGRKLGGVGDKGKIVKEIPYSDYLIFKDQTVTSGQLAMVSVPTLGAFRIRVERLPGADPAAPFNLAIVAPDAAGVLQQRSFSALTTATLPTVDLTSPYSFTVELYADGVPLAGAPQTATITRAIPDIAPSIISVVQQPDADVFKNDCGIWRFGRVVAALFSEEVTAASVQDKLARTLISNYTLDGNQVVGVALQPGNRIAFLALRDPVGPFVPRSITFDNISDRRGHQLASQSVPIEATIEDAGAVVSGKVLQPDGNLLSGAEVRLFTQVQVGLECTNFWYGVSSKTTGADAAFGWDYVLKQTNKIVALNPDDGEFRALPFSVARNGQRLNVNVVFLGRGTLTGKVLGEDGMTPLKDAQIRVTSLTDNSQFAFTTDSSGTYAIAKIPVGNLIVEAVHLGTNSKITQSSYIGAAGSSVELNLVLLTETVRKITVKYGAITGHVLHTDGASAVPGVPVYGFYQDNSQDGVRCPADSEGRRPPECAVASALTSSVGAYNFTDVPSGDYRIYTFDQAASQEGNARITLAPDGTISANILLNGGFGTIKGIVKGADGVPVADAEVGGGLSLTRTDANGLFTLTDVPVGSRTIVAVSQALLAKGQVTVDVSTPGVEYGATIVLQSQGGIYGTILKADNSLASGIKVYLLQDGDGGKAMVASTVSNSTGAYQFANVPVSGGQYYVSAFLPDLSDGNIGITSIRFQGQRVRLDLTFKGKGTVTGGIFDANGTTPLVGKVSVSALRVVAAQSGQELIGLSFEYTPHLQIIDTTFASNRFSFGNVFVGDFVITAAGAFSPDPVTFKGEIKTNGETQDLLIKLTATSVVTGTVYGPDGVTVSKNALITYKSDEFKTICSESGGESSCTALPQGIQSETAVSDEFGKFTLPLVNAGKFTLTVEERDSAGNPTGRIGKLSGLVRAGQTSDVAVRLQARAPVKVTVFTHNSTTPVPNAWVTVEEATNIGNTTRKYTTDANGVVTFSGADALNEGSFTVKAESNDGFVGRASGKIVTDGTEVVVNVYLFDHTVTVKGVVYRPDGITPVANAEVSISNASGDLAFAVTNSAGEYSQDFIPLGDFRAEVFEAATGRRGFATATAYLSIPTVTVNISEMAIGQVQGALFQSGALTPLSRWQITLSQTSPSGRSMYLVVTSGLDGRFVFPGVPVGEFRISAYSAGQNQVFAQGYLTREGEIVDIPMVANLVKPALGSINGWVYHPDGKPAADATVCLLSDYSGQCARITTADSDGLFNFVDVGLGRFTIRAGSQVTRESGMGYGDLPYAGATSYVKVVLAGLGTIGGTVLDSGTVMTGAEVVLEKFPDAGCGASKCTNFSDPTTGRFTFPNVPAGPFTVYAKDPVNPLKNGSAGGILNPGATAEVTVAFADTGSLKVKVIFVNGNPAVGIVAELRRTDGFTLYHDSDGSGLVTFIGVPKGDYLLILQDPAGLGLAKKSLQIVADLDLTNSPIMLDEAPPAVTSSSPLPGQIRVALATPIVITFTEPVQPGSISPASLSVTSAVGPVEGFREMSVNDTVVTFTPTQPLKDETTYSIRVSGVKDRVDRSMLQDFVAKFTTVDITPPRIVSFGPDKSSSGAPLESVIRIMFSEPVNPAAFSGTAITVSDGTALLAGRVDMVFGNTGMVFTPTYPLKENTLYTVTLLPASDLSGNQQSAEPPYTFRSLDRTPPVISSLTTPATVIENAVVTVTPVFGNAADIAVVDWYLNGAPAGAVRVAQSPTYSFSFQALPSLGIPNGTPIKVSAIATDTSGNRALIGTETSISVIADTPPTATITLPAGGAVVRTGDRVVVRVVAQDDMGIVRIAYQANGGQFPASDTVAVTPTALSAQKDFAFYVPLDALPGSQIVINATVVDSKGQSGTAVPVSITVSDATPPVVLFAGLSSGAVVRTGQKITAVVTANDLGGIKQVSFRVNGGTPEVRDITPPQNSVAATFSYTVPANFTSQDTVHLEATAIDVANNSAAAPAVVLSVADTTAPQVTLHTVGNTSFIVPGHTVTIVVDAQDDTEVTGITLSGSGAFSYSNSAVLTPAGTVQSSFVINIPANLAEGTILNLTATAGDASGNVGTSTTLNLTARSLTTLQLPASQLLAAGETVQLAITLDQPAPSTGMQLDLTPSSAALQLQPASLVFAAGETVKNFTLSAMSGGTNSFDVASQGISLGRVSVTIRGGIVTGKVVTVTNQPVASAQVVVNGVTTTSAADGTFLVEGIAGQPTANSGPATAVTIKAYDTPNKLQGAASGVMNAPNGFLRGVTVIVTEAGSVTGSVKRADQTVVAAGVQVDLLDPQNLTAPLFTAFTAADGSYSFPQVPLGTYTVEAHDTTGNRGRSSAYLTVSGAQVVVPVVFLGNGTVTGTVLDSSKTGISGLTVTMQNGSMFGLVSRTVTTDSSGSFTFADVSVGNFFISTKDPVTDLGANTSGSIATNGQTVTANLNLAAWASLEGHVYRVDGVTPAAGVTVQAGGHTTTTDSLGSYRFEVMALSYYTLTAQDSAARTKGSVSVSLQVYKENRVQDVTLNGSSSMIVTVVDSSSTPVPGARVSLTDGFGNLYGSSDALGTLTLEHIYSGNYTLASSSGRLHGSLKGSIAAGPPVSVFITIAADPSATISGTIFAPDGQTPAGGVTVYARSSKYSGRMTTAGDGTYLFSTLPLDTYDLTVYGANGQLRAKAGSIVLTADGEIATRIMTMVGLGTVNGRVLEPNSSTGSPNMPVTVRALNPDFGRSYSMRTNAAGFYQVDQVPVGGIGVSAGDGSVQKLGDAVGTLSGDGAVLTLDVALQSNAVALPQTLYDGNYLDFPVPGNGSLSSTVFGNTGGALLTVTPTGGTPVNFAAVNAGTQEQQGREIALRQPDVGGLSVTRKIYVPQDGYFARYLEIFDNLTGLDKGVTVGVKNGFYSERDPNYYFFINSTSSGDTVLQTGGTIPDYWGVFDNYYGPNSLWGGYSKTAMIWGGPGAATAVTQIAATPTNIWTKSGFNAAWDVTVPANGRVAIMHFVVQNSSVSGATASAERLVQLPPEALSGLSQDELLAIRNFAVPVDGSSPHSALPPLTGSVTVTVQDALGAIPSGALVKVDLQSASPIFNRIYTASMNSGTGQAVFTSNMNNPNQGPQIALPVGPYTVTAKRTFGPNYFGTIPTPVTISTQGGFAIGSTQAVNTLSFTNSGNINGVVRKSTGESLTNGAITYGSGTELVTSPASDGSYSFNILNPGDSYINVSVPSLDGGTPVTVQQKVTVIAGQTVTADITLPPLGTVTGQLLSWNGNPQPGFSVTLTGVSSGMTRTKTTDTGSNFTFSMVPPGAYKLSSTDPTTGLVITGAEFTMMGGETLTQNLQLKKSGRVAASLFYADGLTAPSYNYYAQDVNLQVLDMAGTVLSTNPNVYNGNPQSSRVFASDEAQFKVRMTYNYSQPGGTRLTSAGETTMNGFTSTSSTPLPVSVILPLNWGNVTVQLKNSSGANYSGSAIPIELRDPTGTTVWAYGSSDPTTGKCTINNLIVGSDGFAVKVVMNNVVIAETTAFMTTTGQTQTVDLQLAYDPVAFPKTLYDGNAFLYDIYGDGSLHNGRDGVFYYYSGPGAIVLDVNRQNFTGSSTGMAEDQGRVLSTTQAGLAGLNVNRKIYVPKDGYFARYLDVFTNPGADPVTVNLGLTTNFYYYYDTFAVRAASNGISDTVPTNQDLTGATWAVVRENTDVDPFLGSTRPAVAMIWGGESGASLISDASFGTKQTYNHAYLKSGYQSVVIPAGQSVALMSFLVQQTTVASAKASAERLVQLPPEALSGLSKPEVDMIANFKMPANGTSTLAALPPATGTVNGAFKTYDSLSSSLVSGNSVFLQSSSPYFTRVYKVYADNSGVFTFNGTPNGDTTAMTIPLTGFTLSGVINNFAYSITSPAVSGSFADGSSTTTQDIIFSNSGRIKARVLYADGTTPVTNAVVRASFGTNCQTSYCSTTYNFLHVGDSYLLDFAQAGQHNLTVAIPPPTAISSGGASLTLSGTVTAVTGSDNLIELRLPLLGKISGTIKNRAGNVVPGATIYLRSASGFNRYLTTYDGTNGGPAGSFTFAELPADTYTLEVDDTSIYGVVHRYTVVLAAGGDVSGTYQYGMSGTVTGKVSFRSSVNDATYFPTSVSIDVMDPDTGAVLTTAYINYNSANSSFTTPRFAGNGKPVTVKASYRFSVGDGTYRTYSATTTVASFTSDNQQLSANLTLPADRGNVQVLVMDSNNAALLKPVMFELHDTTGQVASSSYTYSNGQYTFTGIYSDQTTLTARAVYMGHNYDLPVTFIVNGTATVTITIPHATLSGSVFAGDGATPIGSFTYSLTSADGTFTYPCGGQETGYYNSVYVTGIGNVYRMTLSDIYTCSSSNGLWALTQLAYNDPPNAGYNYAHNVPRLIPLQNGDQLALRITSSTFGTFTYNFTYTGNSTVDATLPIFVAKGAVTRADGSAVSNASVTMVVTDNATPPVPHTYAGTTDLSGNFAILAGTTTGTYSLNAQTTWGSTGSYAGSGIIDGTQWVTRGLDITLEPSGTITGTVMRAGLPLANASLTLTLTDRSFSQRFSSDSQGQFTALDVPFAPFTVSASAYDSFADGDMYSNTVSGTLTALAPTADVQLVFDLDPGTVYGTVHFQSGSVAGSYNSVTLTRVSTGELFYPSIDGSGNGFYEERNLPADGYLAQATLTPSVVSPDVGVAETGSSYGILTNTGTLRLDLNLRPEVSLQGTTTTELLDSTSGFKYGIGVGGVLAYGGGTTSAYSSPFNGSYLFYEDSAASDFTATSGWFDPTVSGLFYLKPAVSGGMVLSRKLYLPPAGGYLRYLEIIDNPSASPVSIWPRLYGPLATPASGAWSFNADPATTGYALEQAAGDPLMPQVGMVLQGVDSSVSPLPLQFYADSAATADVPNWYWFGSVPAGGRSCVVHYIFQSGPLDTVTDLEARAKALQSLDGAALGALGFSADPLFGLTADERTCIMNFNVPPAP